MSERPEAKQVPLIERLESVPADAALVVAHDPFRTAFFPTGAITHEAAAELRRLHAVNAELLEALKAIELALALPSVAPTQVLHESGAIRQGIRAAIAKAEEVQP